MTRVRIPSDASMKIVSACLAGINCRYNGASRPNKKVIELVNSGKAIPVCPEQLAGLPTPRGPFEQCGGKVIDKKGKDFTQAFERGALAALKVAKKSGCTEAVLKARSLSCGVGKIYDGSFSGKLVDGDGIFTKLLKKEGINCITEEELE